MVVTEWNCWLTFAAAAGIRVLASFILVFLYLAESLKKVLGTVDFSFSNERLAFKDDDMPGVGKL